MTSLLPSPGVPSWRQAGWTWGLLLAALLWLFRDTAGAMVAIWMRSDTFAHGFLVPPIVAWLVWRQRAVLARLTPTPAVWAWGLLALAGLGWLLGDLVAVNALTQLALVSLIVLLVPAVLGLAVTRAIAFPLAFLFFAVPIGEFAMPQLMAWTADFTVLAVRLSGIPVYREGLQFVIPTGQWSVVEACSGVRYLIASLTVGTLFAYLNYQSLGRRALFILVSLLVPILANWLRAYMIVMLGHFSGNTLAVGVDHLIYGWVFFGVVILLMFWVGARWSEPEPELSALAAPLASLTPAPTPARFALTGLVLAAVLVLPLSARWAIEQAGQGQIMPLQAPAQLSPGWVAASQPVAAWQPAFQNPVSQFNTSYGQGGQAVGLYVGYYRQQNYASKLVSSENVLVPTQDAEWSQVASASRQVNLGPQSLRVRTGELRASAVGQFQTSRLVAWQIYWVNGTWTASDTLAKVWGAFYRLIGRGDDAAVVIAYALKGEDGAGEAALSAFMQANAGAIEVLLQATRQSARP